MLLPCPTSPSPATPRLAPPQSLIIPGGVIGHRRDARHTQHTTFRPNYATSSMFLPGVHRDSRPCIRAFSLSPEAVVVITPDSCRAVGFILPSASSVSASRTYAIGVIGLLIFVSRASLPRVFVLPDPSAYSQPVRCSGEPLRWSGYRRLVPESPLRPLSLGFRVKLSVDGSVRVMDGKGCVGVTFQPLA